MTVLFLVGSPAAGKTTLARAILGIGKIAPRLVGKPKWTIMEPAVTARRPVYCAAGHYIGGTFDGADTVPYNGVFDALLYWQQHLQDCELTLLDGDRFSYGAVVKFFTDLGHRVSCAYLTADVQVLRDRREARGSKQNEAWVKGRATKSWRFVSTFPGPRVILPAAPVEDQMEMLRTVVL